MKSQTKVGLLFLFAIAAIFLFVAFLGQFSLFGNYKKIVVTYNFAGGLQKGSHVRLMGVKVGKVEAIDFKPNYKSPDGEEVKLHVTIRVADKAWSSVRKDSRYYINLAGIIGEKYLEITPGTTAHEELTSGDLVRGVDPPRIDQLISQGYALAGKILSMVEDNEGSVVDTIQSINGLVKNLNKVLITIDRLTTDKKYSRLVTRISTLSDEMTILMKEANEGDIKAIVVSIKKILGKIEDIDEKEIRTFLQEEGIKARVAL